MVLNVRLLRGLQIATAVGCLVLLWRVMDGEAALGHLAAANTAWMVTALLALTLQTMLSALRWRLTAERLGIALAPRTAVSEYYLAQFVNQLLPGGLLGDAGRALRARAHAGLLASGQAVIFERLAGQLGLLAVFAAGVVGSLVVPGGFDPPRWLLLPVALVLLIGAGGVGVLYVSAGSPRADALRPPAKLVGAFVHAVAAREVRTAQVLMSLGTALCNIAAFACCAAAIGLPLTLPAALVLVPLILFTMLIPLTVSGWGLREGAAAALLPLVGATGAEGLAAGVAFGLAMIVAALPGVVALAGTTVSGPVES